MDRLRPKLSELDCAKLLLLIHVHDTFKADAQRGVAISDPKSHASLARAFLAEYCTDPDMLAMVQLHDEPYALYRRYERTGTLDHARLDALVATIRDWNLFLAFQIVDRCTAGKSREPLFWLFGVIHGKVQTEITINDVLS